MLLMQTDASLLDDDDRDYPICMHPLGTPNPDRKLEDAVQRHCGHVIGEDCMTSWMYEINIAS